MVGRCCGATRGKRHQVAWIWEGGFSRVKTSPGRGVSLVTAPGWATKFAGVTPIPASLRWSLYPDNINESGNQVGNFTQLFSVLINVIHFLCVLLG